MVDLADPRRLSAAERAALLQRIRRANMALYRSPVTAPDKSLPRQLGAQLGLHRLDANWLADEDGISRITVADTTGAPGETAAAYIPYTDRAIQWHTDGYYHPQQRRIHGMILHCVQPAREGGETTLMDHEMAYIALRDADPRWVRSLMADDAMTIPAQAGRDRCGACGADRAGVLRSTPTAARCTCATPRARAASSGRPMPARARPWPSCASCWPAMRRSACACACSRAWASSATTCCTSAAPSSTTPPAPRLLYRARYLDRVPAAA